MHASLIQSVRTVWKNTPAVYECIDLKAKHAQDIIFFVPGNPAILLFYENFLMKLHEKLNNEYRVIAGIISFIVFCIKIYS
jgi:hypothetical protein